MGEITML